jgi:hypothetical protein
MRSLAALALCLAVLPSRAEAQCSETWTALQRALGGRWAEIPARRLAHARCLRAARDLAGAEREAEWSVDALTGDARAEAYEIVAAGALARGQVTRTAQALDRAWRYGSPARRPALQGLASRLGAAAKVPDLQLALDALLPGRFPATYLSAAIQALSADARPLPAEDALPAQPAPAEPAPARPAPPSPVAPRTEPPPAPPPAVPPPPAPLPAPHAGGSPAQGAELDRVLRRTGESTWEAERSFAERALSGNEPLAECCCLTADRRGGYRIECVKPGNLFARMGFENGDVIQSVNGHSLASTFEAMIAYATLRGAPQLVVRILRGSAVRTHTYVLR